VPTFSGAPFARALRAQPSAHVDRGDDARIPVFPPRYGRCHWLAVMNDTRVRLSSTVRASASEDGLILLDVSGGLVLASNAVGARIWQLIEQRATPDQIAARLAEEYAIGVDRARRDVRVFLDDLAARGLIAPVPEGRCA
jgi:hypothetical protein